MIEEHDEQFYVDLMSSFQFFLQQLWFETGRDKVAPLGPIELDMADWIAHGPTQRGVLAYRSVGKTHFVMAYAGWRLLIEPTLKILVVSKSNEHAVKAIGLLREWIRSVSFLQHLDPDLDPLASDSTKQFDVAGIPTDNLNPSVLAKGIDGQITGTHCHLLIPDDIETPENSKTVESRAEVRAKVKNFSTIASFGKKEVVYVGTFHHPQSLYLDVGKAGSSYSFRTWTFVYPEPDKKHLNLAPIITEHLRSGYKKPGELTCPLWWTPEDIARQKAEGESHWRMQLQLECNLDIANRFPLRLSDIIVFECQRDQAPISIAYGTVNKDGNKTLVEIPIVGRDGDKLYRPIFFDATWAKYTETIGYIDPSGRGRDLTGFSVVGQLASYLYVKACYGFAKSEHGDPEASPGDNSSAGMDKLARLARKHGVRTLYYESNADTLGTWGPLFEAALKRAFLEPGQDPEFPEGWKCSLEPDHATGQKELRIVESIEPVLSSHRLAIHPDCLTPAPGVPAEHELQYQIAYLTRDRGCFKEDGKIDSLAGAIRKLGQNLRIDPAKATAMSREREIEKEMKRDREKLLERFGAEEPEPSWITGR